MPGGRPRKVRHAGGRPTVYHSEESRKAARKALQRRWYFQPEVHVRVKEQMRQRHSQPEELPAGDRSSRIQATAIQPDEGQLGPERLALRRARDVHTQFTTYIESSAKTFLQTTVRHLLEDYTPGEPAPLLDRIEEELQKMLATAQQALHDLLNAVGAWGEEYLEGQHIVDDIQSLSKNIIEIQCLVMEEALETAISQGQFSFLQ